MSPNCVWKLPQPVATSSFLPSTASCLASINKHYMPLKRLIHGQYTHQLHQPFFRGTGRNLKVGLREYWTLLGWGMNLQQGLRTHTNAMKLRTGFENDTPLFRRSNIVYASRHQKWWFDIAFTCMCNVGSGSNVNMGLTETGSEDRDSILIELIRDFYVQGIELWVS
jgi:hypothetical protein